MYRTHSKAVQCICMHIHLITGAAIIVCRVIRLTSLDSQEPEWDRLYYDQKGVCHGEMPQEAVRFPTLQLVRVVYDASRAHHRSAR